MAKNHWTQEEDKVLTRWYEIDEGADLLQTFLPNRNYNAIKARAESLGIKRQIKYTKNEKFFEIPNLENCWLAGYFASDACLCDSNNFKKVNCVANIKDINYLKQIKEIVNYNGIIRIKTVKNHIKNYRNRDMPGRDFISDMSYLDFYDCGKWHHDLFKNWSLTPRKTYTLQPPNLTDLKLILAYLVGLLEGDGTIHYSNDKKSANCLALSFLGTKSLLLWIKDIFDKITPGNIEAQVHIERDGANVYSYRIAGARAFFIAKMMLSLKVDKMERKWHKALNYIKDIETSQLHHLMRGRLRDVITPEIINFLSGTNQELTAEFLEHVDTKGNLSIPKIT